MAQLSMASANLHAGIDGFGRRFDAVGGVCGLDADVIVLQEDWTPAGSPGISDAIAERLGYALTKATLAEGRRGQAIATTTSRWLSRKGFLGHDHSLYLDSKRPLKASVARRSGYLEGEPGAWGTAVVSRYPITAVDLFRFEPLRRDRSVRVAIFATIEVEGTAVTIVAAHMSHLTYGSPLHYRGLSRHLHALGLHQRPCVIGGDMNNWGPPTVAMLPGFRRAVTGRSWPSWRPHSQLDHLLVSAPVGVLSGEVCADIGSDHRPVRAELTIS